MIRQMPPTDYKRPEYFINRELSWLAFNARVLEEAQDASQPLLERLKFLSIVSSNLDEFFEIRVAGLKQQVLQGSDEGGPDGLDPEEVLAAVRTRVLHQVGDQYDLWNNELVPELVAQGVEFPRMSQLSANELPWTRKYFEDEVYPVLTPLAIDPSHPFPQLLNKSHNVVIELAQPNSPDETCMAIVQIPRVLSRLVRIPDELNPGGPLRFLFLKSIIKPVVGDLFPGVDVRQSHGFRVTRNSDLYIDEEEVENLLSSVEEELRKRSRGNAVRLEVESSCPAEIERYLLETFHLAPADCYRLPGPLTFLHLNPLVFGDQFPKLRDRPFSPVYSRDLPTGVDMFAVLRRKDVLLHHPYETFNSVVEFIGSAAADPQVLAIKLTLYRTSGDSPILHALIAAARAGKQVTALMEIKARFDEANNINWSRKLEEAGVHVVYGLVGLKTHCKLLLVVRRDEDRIRLYAHLGTGNYHPRTARLYTDLGLLTTRESLTQEVAAIFNKLTGLSGHQEFNEVIVAPFGMAQRFLDLIAAEAANALEGKPARIIAKVNSLVDEKLIVALYQASNAGVKVDLIVRGICCLRPGVPGVSENIRVVSIVGRFLEHHRIFYFENAGDPLIFAGSADWMPRNLYRRVEVVFPLLAPEIRQRVSGEILDAYLKDHRKGRELRSDGSYVRLRPFDGEEPFQAQLFFRETARAQQESLLAQQLAAAVVAGDADSVPLSLADSTPGSEK